MVFLKHRHRVYYSLTTAIEATALFVQQHVKGAFIVYHVTPPHGEKMAAIPDDCERTATVALPTATSPGLISGEVGIVFDQKLIFMMTGFCTLHSLGSTLRC